ncbi:MAG TPA: hypothetical protein VK698_25905 [Kofleriaceae bacterium]|nr:hypothetical protein [Kofleriaceae bacterium]
MANYNPPTSGAGVGGSDTGKTLGNAVAEEAKGVTGALGTRLERAGDYLEDKGKAAFLSDRLHSAGRYLQENDVRTITRAVDEAICAHPYRSMLFGLGIGWAVGKFLSR